MNFQLDPIQGPTLYDFAGLSPTCSTPDLLAAVGELSTRTPGASRVRAAFALEALLDDEFRKVYDDHLRKGTPWREENQLPLLPDMPDAEWGSDEMGEWVRQAGGILTPRRPSPSRLASMAATARRLSSKPSHRFLYPFLLMLGSLPVVTLGELPVLEYFGGLLDFHWQALAATAVVISLLGAILRMAHDTFNSWLARAALTATALVTPTLSAQPELLAVHLLVLAVLGLLGTAAERAYRDWLTTEPLPPAPRSSWEPVDGRSCTRLGASTSDPVQAASVLRAWATRLGHPVVAATPADLVAATIASDCWAFALGADSLTQAASFGPASLGAISAAVARAAGYPEPTMPILPGREASERRMPGLTTSVRDWRAWAELQLGRREAGGSLIAAAGDLVWGGGDEDRLAHLARTLLR